MPPRVTAAINNYNYGEFLPAAIESVLEQDYTGGIDLLVVDDGSTDDSAERVKPYLDRIEWIPVEHGGQAGAFNAAFERSKNDIVCLLDSDDWWRKDRVRRVVEVFESDPAIGFVQHYLQEVDADGEPLPKEFPKQPETYSLEDFLERETFFTGTSGESLRLSKAKPIFPVPKEIFFCADEYLYHHTLFFAKMGNIDSPLGFRRLHGRNLFAGNFPVPERLEANLDVQAKLDAALERRLKEHGKRFSPTVERWRRLERLQKELLLHRYRRRFGDYFRVLRRILKEGKGAFKWFRALTLLLAFVTPRGYLFLQKVYAKSGLVKVRESLAPH